MSLRWHYPNQVLRSGLTARSQPARAGSLLVFFIIIALEELQDKKTNQFISSTHTIRGYSTIIGKTYLAQLTGPAR